FHVKYRMDDGDLQVVGIEPGGDTHYENISQADLWFSPGGELHKVKLLFRNGSRDEIAFQSWAMLAADDPEIVRLNRLLESMPAAMVTVPSVTGQSAPPETENSHGPMLLTPGCITVTLLPQL
ncbi:MAG: hypothetical protein V2B18_06085, partial [Pseudomonadota bacterium]